MKKSTLNRMLELADIKPTLKENKLEISSFGLVKETVNGKTYAIVREGKKYFIKEADTKQNLTESDFDYVGGLSNKGKKYYHSFSEATKQLNLVFEEINNHYDVNFINILESDDVLSEKKYVLKLNKKKKEEPTEEPSFDMGTEEGGDTEEEESFDFGDESSEEGGDEEFDFGDESSEEGGDEFDFGDEGEEDTEETDDEFDFGDEGEEDTESVDNQEEGGDNIKDIQSTTGKLGQQLRDVEDLSSDMKKWVAKSVLAALDLDNMDSNDKDDVLDTIKDSGNKEQEVEESYDSYMDDKEYDDYDSYMGEYPAGYLGHLSNDQVEESYDSYMEEDNPNIGGDEELEDDMLLLDDELYSDEEKEALYPQRANKYRPSASERARRQADRDITKHFHRNAEPGYDSKPVEKWAKHKLPYDTRFDSLEEDDDIFSKKDIDMNAEPKTRPTTRPSEPGVKPDRGPGREKPSRRPFRVPPKIDPNDPDAQPAPKARRREYDTYMDDVRMAPSPAPARPKTSPNPDVKPGKPGTDRPSPSRRPFKVPPKIDPNDPDAQPAPKADYDSDVEFE